MEDIQILRSSQLFQNIEPDQIRILLDCLCAVVNTYQKGEFILHRGEPTRRMGIVLEGTAHIIKEDFWGNRVILGQSGPGQLFAESYACLGSENLTVSVVAAATTRVMFLDVGRLFQTCSTACGFHTRMIHNLTQVLAGRNLMLTQKVEHMAQKTTREKLLSYLSGEAQRAGSAKFSIPYDRQELADYLSVDRSAMCTELSKLQRQGILRCRKKEFELLELPREF
ncbi:MULTISPECIES: Crp/Fnr family transcriptional regulator [Allofournierella]|uniref:Crp/Fnr family transcriptional regulator n=1 Tax=Allofournierella massiliensis TaxID=1650663 RepID=A0ABT7USE3_9FIRM|nr:MULTISPECIES: Crp/Fnr family transcriptional regulator [Fournierella]MDM8201814.1 Crp/Fnr family transcriptional regulator [Fournierella massiliensis]